MADKDSKEMQARQKTAMTTPAETTNRVCLFARC